MKQIRQIVVGVAFLAIFPLNLNAQEQGVEVTVATGMDITLASALSPNNRFACNAVYNSITIWDVNTGRMIRNVQVTPSTTQMIDSVWFSSDNAKVKCQIVSTNDVYEVDVATGDKVYHQGPPMDWSTYKYMIKRRQSSSNALFQPNPKDLSFTAPNGKSTLIFKVIKNPVFRSDLMPYMYELLVKTNGKVLEPLDTVIQAGFTWSPDGNFALIDKGVVDMRSGRWISQFKKVPYSSNSIMFMPGTHTPVTAAVQSIRIWDFPDVEFIPIKDLSTFKTSYDGKYVVCERYNLGTSQRSVLRMNIMTKKKDKHTFKTKNTGYLIDVSKDGARAALTETKRANSNEWTTTYSVIICDFETGESWEIENTTKALFTLDKDVVIIDSIGMNNCYYNIKTKERRPFKTSEYVSQGSYFIARGGKYLTGSEAEYDTITKKYFMTMYLWDVNTGETVFKKKSDGIYISGVDVSKDEKYVAFGTDNDNAILIYEMATGKLVHKFTSHTAYVEKLYFSDDNKRLMSGSLDGTRRLWNLETGKEMASLVNTGVKDYAIITPDQYYFATKGAKKLIHFVKGDKIYPFSQFDLKYNRPDIIIKSLEASNQGLVKPFYYAYQKRLKRLGFTEEMLDGDFHMPTAEIANVEELPIATDKEKLKLKIKGEDSKYNLDRVLIRVNEVPISGKNGISVKSNESKQFEAEYEIELSYGKNLIEVSVMNEKGVESIASNVTVDHRPSEFKRPDLYLYTIGVSSYQQSEYNLTYAAKDAHDIQNLYGGAVMPFGTIYTKQLTNEQVTLESVEAIKEELKNTHVDDAVCVFFAGHGILDVELNYYLASYDIDFKNPSERGIPYEAFENILDDIPARKKLIMIDACHSGEIDKDEVAMVDSENTTESDGDITFRAVNSTTLKTVGLNNSFELMKELFNDVRKSSGTVVISSAGGMEYAMEGGEWKNGVFTYCFLNGIKNGKADLNGDGKVYLSEMNNYIREEVFNLTDGQQRPTNRAEVMEVDWRIW